MAKTYLDSAGLQTFLTNLKTAYSGNNTAAFSTFTVGQAGKLANARTVTFATGDVTGSFTFDGSANVSNVALSVADAVASASGVGGSHGLMTAAQAEKLAGVAEGAQVNVLEGVQIKNNGDSDFSDLTISSKKVQIDLSGYALKSDITSVLNFKGTKASSTALPESGNKTGDVWLVSADNSEYVWTGSVWEKLGPVIDLSGYVEKTQKVNGHALSGDITLDGSDIALTGYTKASSSSAVAATDTVNAAVGKLEKKVDDNASAISGLQSGAKSYAFAEGSVNGAFQVTETTGSTAGAAQSITIHGLGSAAYTDSTAYVAKALEPAEAGAEVNKINVVKFKGKGDSSATAITIDNTDRSVTVDVSDYAKTADLSSFIALTNLSVSQGSGDYVTGLSYDNTSGAFTSTRASKGAVADNDTGLVDGNTVYDYIETLPISTATINELFGISNS